MNKSIYVKVYLALISMTLLFGSSFIATKIALQELHPFQVVALRYALAFFAMSFIWRLRQSFKKLFDTNILKDFIIIMLSGPVAYFIFETYGIKLASPAEISFMISLIPIGTFILASILLKEKLTSLAKLSIFISIVGALLLIFGGQSRIFSGNSNLLGKILGLGAVFSASIYNVSVRKTTQKITPLELTYLQSFFAFLFYGILNLFFASPSTFLNIVNNFNILGALLFLGIGCSFIAIYFMNYGFAHLESTKVAMFGNFIPVVTLIISMFLGMGGLHSVQVIGGLLILFSLFLANANFSKDK